MAPTVSTVYGVHAAQCDDQSQWERPSASPTQVMGNEQEASLIAKDLYGILGIDESVDTSKVKSMYAQPCR